MRCRLHGRLGNRFLGGLLGGSGQLRRNGGLLRGGRLFGGGLGTGGPFLGGHAMDLWIRAWQTAGRIRGRGSPRDPSRRQATMGVRSAKRAHLPAFHPCSADRWRGRSRSLESEIRGSRTPQGLRVDFRPDERISRLHLIRADLRLSTKKPGLKRVRSGKQAKNCRPGKFFATHRPQGRIGLLTYLQRGVERPRGTSRKISQAPA